MHTNCNNYYYLSDVVTIIIYIDCNLFIYTCIVSRATNQGIIYINHYWISSKSEMI